MNGSASIAAYQSALRAVTYANTSATPATVPRAITFTVNDGALTGSGNRTIAVTSPTTRSAMRSLPTIYSPGVPVAVSVAVNPGPNTLVQAIEETPPTGWSITAIDNNGSYDTVNGKVKWGPFFDSTARTLSYVATPPVGTSGTKTFGGSVSFDGDGVIIVGDSSIMSEGGGETFTLSTLVQPAGSGAIQVEPPPDQQGKYLSGTIVTITAVPNAGFLFSAFSGDSAGAVNPTVVTVDSNKEIVAMFSPVGINPSRGEYSGLVRPAEITSSGQILQASSGFLGVNVTRGDRFTGVLIYGGERFSIRGRFTRGSASVSISRRRSSPMRISLTGGVEKITGKVEAGALSSVLSLDRNVFTSRRNRPLDLGQFTFIVQPEGETSSIPGGFGAGRLVVKSSGRVQLTGRLGDGSRFSHSTIVSAGRTVSVYAAPYGKRGVILGEFVFENTPATSDGTAILNWFKSPVARDKFYPIGFDTTVELVASRYERPKRGERALALPDQSPNALLTFVSNENGLRESKPITINRRNRVLSDGREVQMTLREKTGLYRGRFIDQSGRKRAFFGGVLQQQNLGGGAFFGDTKTGPALLESSN